MGHHQGNVLSHHGSPNRKQKGSESMFKDITAENFPNLGTDMNIHIQEAQKTLNKINPTKITLRHIK